jgi:glucosamine-6-phosphate deaminase
LWFKVTCVLLLRFQRFHVMRIVIRDAADQVAQYAAELIINRVRDFQPTKERPFVLGLPTGGTPVRCYQRLILAFREGKISFQNVVTFNMDEYVGLPRDHPESYWSFMKQNLFSFVDIPPENINILDGNAPDLVAECQRFEDKIQSYGGIELFLGGVGSDGHIAFNEPGSSLSSLTRVKSLNKETISDNARFFDNDLSKVPTMALTVGVQTVMASRQVVIIAIGGNKALAVAHCVEEGVSHGWPISALQMHRSTVLIVDEDATRELRVKTVRYFKGLQSSEDELKKRQANAASRTSASKL